MEALKDKPTLTVLEFFYFELFINSNGEVDNLIAMNKIYNMESSELLFAIKIIRKVSNAINKT